MCLWDRLKNESVTPRSISQLAEERFAILLRRIALYLGLLWLNGSGEVQRLSRILYL